MELCDYRFRELRRAISVGLIYIAIVILTLGLAMSAVQGSFGLLFFFQAAGLVAAILKLYSKLY